jgi:ABC-type taurine transport system ATPase subunit
MPKKLMCWCSCQDSVSFGLQLGVMFREHAAKNATLLTVHDGLTTLSQRKDGCVLQSG